MKICSIDKVIDLHLVIILAESYNMVRLPVISKHNTPTMHSNAVPMAANRLHLRPDLKSL